MNVKDLVVTIKANVQGLEKLKAFNEQLKTALETIQKIKGVKFNLQKTTDDATKSLAETESSESSSSTDGKKSGKLGLLTFLKGLKAAPYVAALIYIGKAITDVIKKVASLTISLSQTSYEVLRLSRNFGVSTDSIQRFGNLAVAQGVKLGDFQSAISNLRKMSADIMLGRGDISPFAILGINPHQDPEKILVQLQQRLKQLPEAVGTAFASDLGLSPDMINFIRRTDFGRLARQPKLSGGELRSLEDMRSSALEFLNLISITAQKILIEFKPVIDGVIKPITNFLKVCIKDIYRLKLITVGTLTAIAGGLVLINPALAGVLASFTALALVIEDIVKSDGKGIIGWVTYLGLLINDIINDAVESMLKPFKMIYENSKKGLSFFNPIDDAVNSFKFFKDIFSSAWYHDPSRLTKKDTSIGARSSSSDINVNLSGAFTLQDAYGDIMERLNINDTSTTVSGVQVEVTGVNP